MTASNSIMGSQKLLPIILADTAEEGVKIAGAMAKSGLNLVEVVLRTPESLNAVRAIKAAYPDLKVAAGTVTDEKILADAIEAGADIIVTPAVSDKLLKALKECGVPVIPGVSNTGEILLAKEYGFTEQKLFPATLAGGVKFLKAVSTVFQDVTFCPTGGVNEQNKDEFLALGNVYAVGGTWVCNKEWVANGEWDKITEACKLAI